MILLDTHAWVWWVNGQPSLSRKAERSIQQAARHAHEQTQGSGVVPERGLEGSRALRGSSLKLDSWSPGLILSPVKGLDLRTPDLTRLSLASKNF